MDETEFIVDASRLVAIFGEWPSFHDAEVLSMHLDRAGHPGACLEARIHVFRMTDQVDPRGFHVLTSHTLVTMRFEDISLRELKWFNTQNCLSELIIQAVEPESNEDGRPFRVRFDSSWGVDAELFCTAIRVVGVERFAPAS